MTSSRDIRIKRRKTIAPARNGVNPCRPGFGASCSFCCGSHNFTLAPEFIEDIFIRRGMDTTGRTGLHPEDSLEEKLVPLGMQCPHIGISPMEPELVGCLTYHDSHEGTRMNSFFKGTCKSFLCVAWRELTDRQILFAAELMADWYYYSLLIQCPELLEDLCAAHDGADDVPDDVLDDLKAELEERLREDDLI